MNEEKKVDDFCKSNLKDMYHTVKLFGQYE